MNRPASTFNYATASAVVLESALCYATLHYSGASWHFKDGAEVYHNHDGRPYVMLPDGQGKLLFKSYHEYGEFAIEVFRQLSEAP